MSKARIPNNAKWCLEYVYGQLVQIERNLKRLEGGSVSQVDMIRFVSAARIAASRSRERIVQTHPNASAASPRI